MVSTRLLIIAFGLTEGDKKLDKGVVRQWRALAPDGSPQMLTNCKQHQKPIAIIPYWSYNLLVNERELKETHRANHLKKVRKKLKKGVDKQT